jgi:RNA polymerase sigma-70 factor (ECF subfamily)
MSRHEIIFAIARRDPNCLDRFNREFRPAVFAIALRMVRDERDAEEVVQDVTWSVYRHAKSFRGESDPWRWVHRITRNASLMVLRKRRNHTTAMEPEVLEAVADRSDSLPAPPRADELHELRLMTLRMESALQGQEALNQRLFHMMDVEGRSKEEVSRELGLSIPAVKARLHRVRVGLRRAAAAEGRPASSTRAA